MATTLFLRDTKDSGIGVYRYLQTTRGPGVVTGVVDSIAGGTQIQWTKTLGGELLEFISPPLSAGFTLSGTMTFNIWALEFNMAANCGGRARVFKYSGGVETEVGGGPYDDGVEFGTSNGVFNWTGAPTSTAFAAGDRLIVKYYITNVGTMGDNFDCTLNYAGVTAGASGDTYFQINENVTFGPDPGWGLLLNHSRNNVVVAL